MAPTSAMQSFTARLASFSNPPSIKRRRGSSTSNTASRRKGAKQIKWPHEAPASEDLARSGFFFCPHPVASPDNVQCFLCGVKLDGWEPTDAPLVEHLAHSPACAWAISVSCISQDESRDPTSDELVAARRATFEHGSGWPHEGKRGWRCTVTRMVEAGWCYDPSAVENSGGEDGLGDGVTCLYCSLSLDGWEPKDDPREEHQRRSPACRFFTLCERYATTTKKGRRSQGGRVGSVSVAPQEPDIVDLVGEGDNAIGGTEDSILSNTSTASQAKRRGAKKSGRKPKEKKEAQSEAEDLEATTQPFSQSCGSLEGNSDALAPPPKRTRTTRQSRQTESSVIEISSMSVAAPTQADKIRGHKSKTTAQRASSPPSILEQEVQTDEMPAQLQIELNESLDLQEPDAEATPQPQPTRTRRGTKRTSDGVPKLEPVRQHSSLGIDDFPVPPSKKPVPTRAAKKPVKEVSKGGREKASTQVSFEIPLEEVHSTVGLQYPLISQDAAPAPSSQAENKQPNKRPKVRPRKASTTSNAGRGRKASSTRNSRPRAAQEPVDDDHENAGDLANDEREIESELKRIADEQAAILQEQDKIDEFETSPSQAKKLADLNKEVTKEDQNQPPIQEQASKWSSPNVKLARNTLDASPSESDKENAPSSAFKQPISNAKSHPHAAQAPALLSPSKTARMPLAPGTPNRSPIQTSTVSPSKKLSHLTSAVPWVPPDLEILLAGGSSPGTTSPETLGQKLAQAAAAKGGLTADEQQMTVEQWIKAQAEARERELKRRCESMVSVFEREGLRAVESVRGIVVMR